MNGVLLERLTGVALPAALSMLLLAACVQEAPENGGAVVNSDTATEADAVAAADRAPGVDPIARGRENYMTFCASCHGRDGKGDGPVAEVMTTVPADLTRLRAENDGDYPVDSVYAYIDGRADIQAHGTREMPVWGNVWGEVSGARVPEEEVDQRIRELVEYIRTIQEAPEGPDES